MSNDSLGDLSNQILTMMSDNTLGLFETRFRRLFRFYPIIHKVVWRVPSVPVAYVSDDNGSSSKWASRHPPYCFIFREMTSFTLLPPCLVNKAFGLENVEITVTRVGATNDVVISTKNLSYAGT